MSVISWLSTFLANESFLTYLTIIIVIAAILALITRIIKQPPIIGYLIAGILVGPLFLNIIGPANQSSEFIQIFAHIGVAFLLFIVGLSLDLRVLKEIGGVASLAGICEIAVTSVIGFLIAIGLGFTNITAIYIATALAFSSTVVVVKILSDKKEIDTLHGRIALGILIVEDFVAAIALMAIPLITNGNSSPIIIQKLLIVLALITTVILLGTFVFSKLMNYLARNQEVLFLFGIAWALTLATVFDKLGFSLEIGALIAGISLASSRYVLEVGSKMKPLRDFFVVLFFVFFGSQLAGTISPHLIKTALILSAFILIGKPIIVMSLLRVFGYKKRTNFLAGSSLAQISEFSLIIVLLGFNLGQLTQEIMSLVILVAVITIGISSYSIYYSHSIFNKLSRLLSIFEGRHKEPINKEEIYEIILIGYHRMGYKVLSTIKTLKKSFAVIDYNPKVLLSLSNEKVNSFYGDAGDKNFLAEIPIHKAKLVISTIPDEYTNRTIQEHLKKLNSNAVFIATVDQPRQAYDLYKDGVDYVVIPHHLGGDYLAHLIKQFGTNKDKYKEIGKKHLKELNKGKNNSTFS